MTFDAREEEIRPMKKKGCIRRELLRVVLTATVFMTAFGCNTAPTGRLARGRPNIVFIMADDLGWGDVGYHAADIATPNIDRLAGKGVRLEQHYVQPMCTPTRVALLTGRYPSRFGNHAIKPCNEQVLPFGTVTLASALKSVGYDTAISGKWHLGSRPEWGPWKFGFNQSYGSLAGGIGPYNHLYKKGPYSRTWHRNGEFVEEEGHATDLIVREAVRFVEKPREGPMFLYVPFTAVHIPVEAPGQWLDFYDGKIAKEDSHRLYAAYTTHMDDGVGRIIEALKRTGQLDNTLIVFTSDNGSFPSWKPSGKYPGTYPQVARLGSNLPYRGYKAQLYEGGIRSPTIVSWPGALEGGTRVDAPMHVVDWMPTLCGIAGYTPKTDLQWDGRDVLPLLKRDETAPGARTIYWKFSGGRSAVRSGDWKLIVHKGNREELFNIAEDPYEKKSMAQQYPDRVAELRALLSKSAALDRDEYGLK